MTLDTLEEGRGAQPNGMVMRFVLLHHAAFQLPNTAGQLLTLTINGSTSPSTTNADASEL